MSELYIKGESYDMDIIVRQCREDFDRVISHVLVKQGPIDVIKLSPAEARELAAALMVQAGMADL